MSRVGRPPSDPRLTPPKVEYKNYRLYVRNEKGVYVDKTKKRRGVSGRYYDYIIEGVRYTDIKDVAKAYNIGPPACYQRVKSDAWPLWTKEPAE